MPAPGEMTSLGHNLCAISERAVLSSTDYRLCLGQHPVGWGGCGVGGSRTPEVRS